MTRYLKRWESPRHQGRNDKGRGGSARQRQRQRQMKLLRKRLQQSHGNETNDNKTNGNDIKGKKTRERHRLLPYFYLGLLNMGTSKKSGFCNHAHTIIGFLE